MTEEHDRSKRHNMMTLVNDRKDGRRESDNRITEYSGRIRQIKVTCENDRSKNRIKLQMTMTDGNDRSKRLIKM